MSVEQDAFHAAGQGLRDALPVALRAVRRQVFNDVQPTGYEALGAYAFATPEPDLKAVNSRLYAVVLALLTVSSKAVTLLADAQAESTIEECLATLFAATEAFYEYIEG
jgi:hypothetical protein